MFGLGLAHQDSRQACRLSASELSDISSHDVFDAVLRYVTYQVGTTDNLPVETTSIDGFDSTKWRFLVPQSFPIFLFPDVVRKYSYNRSRGDSLKAWEHFL